MIKVVGVQFKLRGKVYNYELKDTETVELNDLVVVNTADGQEIATVVTPIKSMLKKDLTEEILPIVRKATVDDLKKQEHLVSKEKNALNVCNELIQKQKLEMKLVGAEFSLDDARLTFFFTAEGRVDFRELVKDLARHFRKQIRLTQIGPRDEASLLGGIGPCGQKVCCASFLKELPSITMNMARVQNLSSKGSSKLSGLCGKLLCCLSYEEQQYLEMSKGLPEIGSKVKTKQGEGDVIDLNILKRTALVQVEGQRIEVQY